jgi:hypothetical protein
MNLSEVHGRIATTSLYYFILLTVWGYWRFFCKERLSAVYWGSLAIAEGLLLIQSGLGFYLWFLGLRPSRSIHILYGIVSMMALPAVYMYTRGRQERAEMLMYGTTTLITVGLILRAMTTALGG